MKTWLWIPFCQFFPTHFFLFCVYCHFLLQYIALQQHKSVIIIHIYEVKWSRSVVSDSLQPHVLGRKVMTNLDSLLKSRDITLPTKVHTVKAMVFPMVMYGCESWTVKKAECRRIEAFELWCWRRLLRVPWTARRSNQSILKEISGCSLEGWC